MCLRYKCKRLESTDVADLDVFLQVSHLTVCLNSALNFLIYTMGGAKYRKAFIDSYYSGAEACRWWRKTSPSSSAASAMAASPVSPNCTPEANSEFLVECPYGAISLTGAYVGIPVCRETALCSRDMHVGLQQACR